MNQELILRIINTLQSPERFKRMTHFLISKVLFSFPPSVRKEWFTGDNYYCPICESHLSTFLNLHRPYHAFCPVCRSLQRHRLVWLFLLNYTDLLSCRPRRMLHIAPEPSLGARFQSIEQLQYVSADLTNKSAMIRMDLTFIPYPSKIFDIIICSHVLEHIREDRKAISELYRVLKENGWALILVPISSRITLEGEIPRSPREREIRYGQFDHVRYYGMDFSNRLIEAGFSVRLVEAGEIVEKDRFGFFGLSESDVIFYCKR